MTFLNLLRMLKNPSNNGFTADMSITSCNIGVFAAGCFRSVYDPVPDSPGSGGSPAASSGVCHRSETEEGQRRRLEVHQPVSDRSR